MSNEVNSFPSAS